MPNVLADSLASIHSRFVTRCWTTALLLLGYYLLYRVGGFTLMAAVAIINIAGNVRIT
jgi:hypothetical protein